MRPLLLPLLLLPGVAGARTLTVGAGGEFALPSQAIAAAAAGDTVSIAPGQYFDCAGVNQPGLVIEGTGPGAVITDKACQGKALLVIGADGVTVRRLTLARARVPDGNGAGIRLEAPSLEVDDVLFENDQVGVLASAPGGRIRIAGSRFTGGGTGGERVLAAVMIPAAASFDLEGSTFTGVAGGQVWAAAAQSRIAGCTIATGAGDAPRPAVWAIDGALLMEGNTLFVGPGLPSPAAAAVVFDHASATLRGNRLENRTGSGLALLLDWSDGTPVLQGNTVGPGDEAVSSAGSWRHRASATLHATASGLRGAAGRAKRAITGLFR